MSPLNLISGTISESHPPLSSQPMPFETPPSIAVFLDHIRIIGTPFSLNAHWLPLAPPIPYMPASNHPKAPNVLIWLICQSTALQLSTLQEVTPRALPLLCRLLPTPSLTSLLTQLLPSFRLLQMSPNTESS